MLLQMFRNQDEFMLRYVYFDNFMYNQPGTANVGAPLKFQKQILEYDKEQHCERFY